MLRKRVLAPPPEDLTNRKGQMPITPTHTRPCAYFLRRWLWSRPLGVESNFLKAKLALPPPRFPRARAVQSAFSLASVKKLQLLTHLVCT